MEPKYHKLAVLYHQRRLQKMEARLLAEPDNEWLPVRIGKASSSIGWHEGRFNELCSPAVERLARYAENDMGSGNWPGFMTAMNAAGMVLKVERELAEETRRAKATGQVKGTSAPTAPQ
jgi:hypothetical protein